MDSVLEKWWTIFDEASLEEKVILQTWIYGFFCYIQDSQECGSWLHIPFEELFDYANEFIELSREEADELKDHFLNLRLRSVTTVDEFQTVFEKFTQSSKIPDELSIIKELFSGEDLDEKTRTKIYSLLKPKEEITTKIKAKRNTRRIYGRRSITPIKRKNGRKAQSIKVIHK